MDAEVRQGRMTGSRVPAVFDAHPFFTGFDLWVELTSGIYAKDEDSRTIMGQCLEPGLLDAAGRILGCKVIPNSRTLVHPTDPFIAGTPDGWVDGTFEGKTTGIDAKVVAPDQARKWDADTPPMYIVMQMIWYMLLTGFQQWIVVALVGGWLRFYTFQRDLEVESDMLAKSKQWWERFVIPKVPPPFGESAEAGRWLQRIYPDYRRDDIRDATPDEAEMLEGYISVRMLQERVEGQRTAFETQIKAAIGNSEGLRWGDGGRFTWKKTKDSVKLDAKAMALGLLEQYVAPSERDDVRAQYTRVKGGERRIHVRHPLLVAEESVREAA